MIEVKWKPRKSGFQPKGFIFELQELKKYDSDLLLDFYLSKL